MLAVLLLTIGLGGCRTSEPAGPADQNHTSPLRYVHDEERGVGCWKWGTGGIACLPDSEYRVVQP